MAGVNFGAVGKPTRYASVTLGAPATAGALAALIPPAAAGVDAGAFVTDDLTFWKVASVSNVLAWTYAGGGTPSAASAAALPTIADLRAVVPTAATTAIVVMAYATAGDGGGGTFAWDAGAVGPQSDGGTTFRPTSAPATGLWRRLYTGPIDVRWFGAVPNSAGAATANSVAIAQAVAVAGTQAAGYNGQRVLFSPGQWYIAATISLTLIDSVILCSTGGAGTWGTAGAYGHHSTKILWAGAAGGTIVSLSQTFRCGVEGLMLDGGGTAAVGIRIMGSPNPGKFNIVRDVNVDNFGAGSVGIWLGADTNPDVAFNAFHDVLFGNAEVGFLQQGSQTQVTTLEHCTWGGCTQYGARFDNGDVHVTNSFFSCGAASLADVYVAIGAQAARFIGNVHEVWGQSAYVFEPAIANVYRNSATVMVGVRAIYQNIVPGPQRVVDYRQDGALTMVGCEWDNPSGQNTPVVYMETPNVGWTTVGQIQEIGCQYRNDVLPVAVVTNGSYLSQGSNRVPTAPTGGAIVGQAFESNVRRVLSNGALSIRDNGNGTQLVTSLGQLFIESEATTTLSLLTVTNNGDDKFVINAQGGVGFYGQLAPPATRPAVTGSRGGNAALASLLAALVSFGLVVDNTTA